eukprot:Skav206455  [mRNA]  locus=scaffold230:163529:164320:- [translate_table: standard]
MAQELQRHALPHCTPKVTGDIETNSGSVDDVALPLDGHLHVAHGLWRIGPGARRFLCRCCLVFIVAVGLAVAVAFGIMLAEKSVSHAG